MEDPSELPAGWTWEKLGALGSWSGGGTPSKANKSFWTNGTIPWVSPKDMKFGRIRSAEDSITKEAVAESSAKFIPENSVLMVTRSGILAHTFPVAVNDCCVTVNQDLKTLTPHQRVNADYIVWYLRAENHRILKECAKHGTTVASIDTDRLKKFPVPIAPGNEQRRIVEKIETLFTRLDKGEEALRKVQKLLARYRQSVLKAAVTGQLTADWRAENAHCLEHGRDLLARILWTRRETWKGRGRYREPAAPDASDLPELPEGWVWASLESLADHKPHAIVDGPFGSKLKTSHYQDRGVRVIRLENIGDGVFVDKKSFVSEAHANELSRHSIYSGDIVIASLGQELPRACIIPNSLKRAIVKADCIRFSPMQESVNTHFILTWLNSWVLRSHVDTKIRGVGRPRLNLGDIRSFAVPLPTKVEQDRISEFVLEAEQKIATMSTWCETELAHSAALRQSALKDAFAGRLVPQDSTDEPAAELLAHIKEAGHTAPRRARKKATA